VFESHYFADILWFLLAAVIVSALSARLRSSPVLGYLTAGVFLGPWGFSLIQNVENSRSVSELGLIFLFFAIGLGMSIERLLILRRYFFGMGGLQCFLSTLVLSGLLYVGGIPLTAAVIIGSGISLSSTAIVLQLLSESGEISSKHGRVTFSVLLFQDLVAILLLVCVDYMSPDRATALSSFSLVFDMLKSVFGVILVIVLGRFVVRPLFKFLGDHEQTDLFMAFTFLVILGTSFFANKFGVSTEFAAFVTGILLSDSEFRHSVESKIRSFRGLLLGLFFMGIGMNINTNLLMQNFGSIIGLVLLFVPIKFLISYLLGRSFGFSAWVSSKISLLIAPAGEFAFVVLGPAMLHGLISEQYGNIAMLVAGLSMMMTPLLDRIMHHFFPSEVEHDHSVDEEVEKL
jgi:monovalent cation:proton antiporter-2 (CPA2) family protein